MLNMHELCALVLYVACTLFITQGMILTQQGIEGYNRLTLTSKNTLKIAVKDKEKRLKFTFM